MLDVGCNNGYGTWQIAQRCARVVGVDVSPKAVQSAVAKHSAPNVEYRMVDGGSLPFANASFDLVTSFQVIEHVEDVEAYLREIRRVLRDGGTAVFTTPNRCIRLDPGQKPWNPFHVREYAAAELAATLRAVFPSVAIEGLFAAPELYAVEHARVTRAKGPSPRERVARRLRPLLGERASTTLLDGARALIPASVVTRLVAVGRRVKGSRAQPNAAPEPLSDFMARWSLDDLFYRRDALDDALDLIAVCCDQCTS